jgi:hypothetical protein
MPDAAATITVKIPFLRWRGRADLEIQIPSDTDPQWHLRAALEIANRDHARLDGARLVGARLVGARLVGARLDGARLDGIRNDFWDVLLRAQPEIPALLATLREGRIDGSTYDGECACLAGTIAHARHVPYAQLGFADASRPIERWFLGIRVGDTPENSQIAAITERWIVEFPVADRSNEIIAWNWDRSRRLTTHRSIAPPAAAEK